jgi:hypothetical protein
VGLVLEEGMSRIIFAAALLCAGCANPGSTGREPQRTEDVRDLYDLRIYEDKEREVVCYLYCSRAMSCVPLPKRQIVECATSTGRKE